MTTLPRAAELYLDELARLLSPAEPVDRVEIVAGVREHIEAQLTDRPDADVTAILRGLGSPDAVARQALEGSDAHAAASASASGPAATALPASAVTPLPVLARDWVLVAVVVLELLTVASAVLVGGIVPARRAWDAGGAGGEGLPLWGVLVVWLAWAVWTWLPAAFLLWASPRWTPPSRVLGTILPLFPLVALILGAAADRPLVGLVVGLVAALASLVFMARAFSAGRP